MYSFMKKEHSLTVRVDEETYNAIDAWAKSDERTRAWMIRRLLEEAIDNRGTPPSIKNLSKKTKKTSK